MLPFKLLLNFILQNIKELLTFKHWLLLYLYNIRF